MKKWFYFTLHAVVLLATLTFATASTLLASEGISVNGSASASVPKTALSEREIHERIQEIVPEFTGEVRPDSISCDILDQNGNFVTRVVAAEIGDAAYFLEYNSGGARANVVDFITVPLFEGSPLDRQFQRFLPAGDDTDILTPFGIPVWAFDATTGPWALIVKNDLGDMAVCRFRVVP